MDIVGLDPGHHGLLYFFLSSLNAHRANSWFKRLQLVSSAAFSVGHGGNDAQKVMGIITAALIASGTIHDFHQMPVWVPLACYTAIAAGYYERGMENCKNNGHTNYQSNPF